MSDFETSRSAAGRDAAPVSGGAGSSDKPGKLRGWNSTTPSERASPAELTQHRKVFCVCVPLVSAGGLHETVMPHSEFIRKLRRHTPAARGIVQEAMVPRKTATRRRSKSVASRRDEPVAALRNISSLRVATWESLRRADHHLLHPATTPERSDRHFKLAWREAREYMKQHARRSAMTATACQVQFGASPHKNTRVGWSSGLTTRLERLHQLNELAVAVLSFLSGSAVEKLNVWHSIG